jgi:hypothetical protein
MRFLHAESPEPFWRAQHGDNRMRFRNDKSKSNPGVQPLKNPSSLTWLGLIFGISVAVEVLPWAMGIFSEKSIVRLVLLVGLFAFLLKGSRFARYALALMYLLAGGLIFSAMGPGMPVKFVILFGFLSVFSVCSAGFLLRSKVLRALTAAKSSEVPRS